MDAVALKNGTEEAALLVSVLFVSLKALAEKDPMAFYDAVMIARPGGYEPFGTNGEKLRGLSIINADNSMHDSVRNVILSAVEGDGLDMILGNPRRNE